MPSALKTVRVFVSSTFKDTHAERDHLVTVVFPELRERLEWLDLDFYDVDLRWGVPERDAGGNLVNSWAYCKRSIKDVEPFFINILGQRYGQIPSAKEIGDYGDRTEFAGMSITEMEIRHAVLSRRLSKRSFFYFRKTTVPKKDTPPDIYKEFVSHGKQVYLKKFKKQIQKESGRPVRFYKCRWTGKRFSKLDNFGRMVLEDLWSGVLRDERYVSKDAWRQVLGHDPDTDTDTLYTDDSQPIPQKVWEKIVKQAKPAPRGPLDVEVEGMAAFATSRLRWFQGRGRELQQLQQFIDSDLPPEASRLCVVKAIAGQGKSALLAKFASVVADSPHLIITHFVGATERSTDTRSLLERLARELDRNGIPKPPEEDFKEDLESLKKQLADRLESYDGRCRIVLLIDAVNQLTAGHDLTWLPRRLGSNVRIVISCIDDPSPSADSPEARVMSALRDREPEPRWVDLSPLEENDVREIIKNHLLEYCRELDKEHIEAICRMEQARNPLYLLVMLHALRVLPGEGVYRKVPDIIANMPIRYPDTVSLFDWVLDRLEVFGKEPMRLWCIYLSLGRVGMSGRELSDLLALKLGKEAARTAFLIERGIRQYLQRRGGQWDFFHRQLRQAVARRYLPEDTSPYHADIAAYLENRWHGANIHALSELPYHQTCGEMWDEIEQTLRDLHFIEAKCATGMTYDLIADYNAALDGLPEAQEEREHAARVRKYTQDLIAYARGEIPTLEIISSVEPWSEERIREDAERIINSPTRLDRIRVFSKFVNSESHALVNFGTHPGFVLQQAYNSASSGPVATAAESIINTGVDAVLLLHLPSWRPDYNPHPALLRALEGHTGTALRWSVAGVGVTPDGKRAVSGSYDKTVRLWDLDTGQCLRVLKGHTGGITSVSVTPDGKRAVSGSYAFDETIRLWDLDTGQCLRVLRSIGVNSVSVTPDGKRAVSDSESKKLRVSDLESGECLRTLEGHTRKIGGVSVTADGKRAVSGSYDKTLRLWDLEGGQHPRVLEGHTDGVRSVSVTPDGKRAVSIDFENAVGLWDLDTGGCLRVLGEKKPFHIGWGTSVSITPDGKRAVSGSEDGTVRLWDLNTGQCLRVLESYTMGVAGVSVTADGKRAVSISFDNIVRLWDLESGQHPRVLEGHTDSGTSVSVTPDGKRAVSGGYDKTVRLWDLDTGKCLRVFKHRRNWIDWIIGHPPFWDVSVTPDGKRAVCGSGDKTVRLWDLDTGKCLRTLKGHKHPVASVSVTPDGRRAVSGSGDKTIRLWDLDTGKCLRVLQGDTDVVFSVRVTPDGRRAVSGSEDGTVRLWDLDTGKCLRTLKGHTKWVTGVRVTPDGRRAVSGSEDKTVRLWDLDTGKCLRVLEGHTKGVSGVSVTPDGKTAVSGSYDTTLRLWDLDTGKCLAVYQATNCVRAVSEIRARGCLACGVIIHPAELVLVTFHTRTPAPPVVTPLRLWLYGSPRSWLFAKRHNGRWDDDMKAVCQWCGQPFPVSDKILDVIRDITRDANLSSDQSPCLELPAEAWEKPRLLSECPLCHKPLKFNPFIVDNRERY